MTLLLIAVALGVSWCALVATALVSQRRFTRNKPDSVERSRQLLLSYLTFKQASTFIYRGYIDVPSESGLVYRINCRSGVYNIQTTGTQFCTRVDPQFQVPLYDQILAQLMLLRTDEWKFVQIANSRPTVG